MSDEYISREEMIDAVDHLHIIPSIDGTGKPTPTEDFRVQFLGTVLHVPSADVVQVVRCRKCKYFRTYRCMDSMPIETCELAQTFYNPDLDFCSLAKCREE